MKFILFICIFCLSISLADAKDLQLAIATDQADIETILQTALVLPSTLVNEQQLNSRLLRLYRKKLPQIVDQTLQPYGYFHSRTESKIITDKGDQPVLEVRVASGEPIRISRIDLQVSGAGAELAQVEKLIKSFPLQEGDILRQDLYERGKALLQEEVAALGFLDAAYLQHQIRVYKADHRAEILLLLSTGQRYAFGPTTFHGGSDYPQRFLRRFISYRQGETFSYPRLGQTQLNLLNADLFQNVTVTPQRDQTEGGQIPINVALQPAPRHQWRPGIGYGTDTGARASLRYRELNLFRRGHQLHGNLLLAQLKQSLITTYSIPDLARLDSQTQLRVGFDREESDSYLLRELFGEAEYQRTFSSQLVGTLFVRLTQEYSEVGLEQTSSQMLLPGVRIQWRGSEAKLTGRTGPTGLYASLELKGAQSALYSDTSLLQLNAQASGRFSLPSGTFALIRLQGGTTWHEDPLRELPVSLRFFAGGDRSVRGYGYQSLGPKDASGQVVGGKHLLVGNFELEKRWTEKWGSAIFYDLGNAFDSFADYELAQGTGIGVRRYTPIGPIRVDLARQIGQSRARWRLHLSMGFDW